MKNASYLSTEGEKCGKMRLQRQKRAIMIEERFSRKKGSVLLKKKHYGSIIAVVRPHAYDLDGALFFEDLVNQPML